MLPGSRGAHEDGAPGSRGRAALTPPARCLGGLTNFQKENRPMLKSAKRKKSHRIGALGETAGPGAPKSGYEESPLLAWMAGPERGPRARSTDIGSVAGGPGLEG